MTRPMRQLQRLAIPCVLAAVFGISRPAGAQEPPPPIPRFAVDLHGTVTGFPDSPVLAASRGLNQAELPGVGLGGAASAHVYLFKVRAVTFGVGGRVTTSGARRSPNAAPPSMLRPVTERFTYLAPQISLNWGTGAGWSYLSGGISTSTWSVVADGSNPLPPDKVRLMTLDYGGGARWFARPHVAFSFDVRFYRISPSTPAFGLPGGPRTTLLVVGAGISLK